MSRKFFFTLFILVCLFVFYPRSVSAQVINEFSSNTSADWIELFSMDDIDISGWILDDFNTSTNMATIPSGTFIGPSTSLFYIVEVSSRLNKSGDEISLFDSIGNLIDKVTYGDKGGPCLPTDAGSIGRYPDANSTIDRFLFSTKGSTNGAGSLDPCPTPISEPTSQPTTEPTQNAVSTPSPSSTPASTKTPTPKPTSTIKPTISPKPSQSQGDVLSIREGLEDSSTTESEVVKEEKKKFPLASIFFILGGGVFSGLAGYSFLKGKKKDYTGKGKDEENKKII